MFIVCTAYICDKIRERREKIGHNSSKNRGMHLLKFSDNFVLTEIVSIEITFS